MPISTDPKKNRAFYWSFILIVVVLFAIRRVEIVIRLMAVAVFFIALKLFFDSFYETLVHWHVDVEEESTQTKPNERGPREKN
jgi:hypothetical protein